VKRDPLGGSPNFGRDIVINDFDVSPDGSAVVFERVQEHSDVVVIDRAQ